MIKQVAALTKQKTHRKFGAYQEFSVRIFLYDDWKLKFISNYD